jgi:hypothetical protein
MYNIKEKNKSAAFRFLIDSVANINFSVRLYTLLLVLVLLKGKITTMNMNLKLLAAFLVFNILIEKRGEINYLVAISFSSSLFLISSLFFYKYTI